MGPASSLRPASRAAENFGDELVLSNICWGLELVLKAYLLANGCPDEHNRRVHRHDLIKASFAAQRLGLPLGRALEWFLVDVAPYARRHAIPEAVYSALSGRARMAPPLPSLLFYAG
jgi:hypothetical protein